LAASTVAIVLLVSLVTVVGLRRWGGYRVAPAPEQVEASNVNDLIEQRRQVIDYWSQRVELKKAQWSPNIREKFDRSMAVIDQAISDATDDLKRNPHNETSELIFHESMNRKLALLESVSDL